jgi:hypothetical protein
VDGQRARLVVRQHHAQLTGAHRVETLVCERQTQPSALQGVPQRSVDAVGDQARRERDALLLTLAHEAPLRCS